MLKWWAGCNLFMTYNFNYRSPSLTNGSGLDEWVLSFTKTGTCLFGWILTRTILWENIVTHFIRQVFEAIDSTCHCIYVVWSRVTLTSLSKSSRVLDTVSVKKRGTNQWSDLVCSPLFSGELSNFHVFVERLKRCTRIACCSLRNITGRFKWSPFYSHRSPVNDIQ